MPCMSETRVIVLSFPLRHAPFFALGVVSSDAVSEWKMLPQPLAPLFPLASVRFLAEQFAVSSSVFH